MNEIRADGDASFGLAGRGLQALRHARYGGRRRDSTGATQITSFQQYSYEPTPTMRRYMHDHFAIARLRGPDLTLCIVKRRR